MQSRWKFPEGANDTAIASAEFPSVQFNNSVISYLRQTASIRPQEGLGSVRPVYTGDIITAEWKTTSNEVLEEWCLVCTATYTGTEGWDACESFTNPETTELLFRDRSGPAMRYSHIVGNIDDVFDRDDTTAVSAAICAFGVPLPPANPMPSPSYDFSSPYPLINSDRKATTGENARYKFDSTTPAGRAEAIPTPQTSFGYSSPTPRPYPPQYTGVTFESNKGPNQKGIIVGSFFGVAVLVTLLTTLVVWLGKRKLKKTALTSVGQEGAPKPTVRRQWTMLETAEPPPAYEAVATTEPTDHRSSTRPPHY